MDTLELIKDAALFGGTIPEERIQEVRDYFDKEQTKMASEDLKQYMTNLLYFARGEVGDMDNRKFDKWVETTINDIDEYFNQSKLSVPSEMLLSFLQYIEESNKDGETIIDNAAFVGGFIKSHLEQSVKEEEKLK